MKFTVACEPGGPQLASSNSKITAVAVDTVIAELAVGDPHVVIVYWLPKHMYMGILYCVPVSVTDQDAGQLSQFFL